MSKKTRIESDSLGNIAVPADKLWGAQTQRALQNFAIGDETFDSLVIHALGHHKAAAVRTNLALKLIPARVAKAINKAATEVAAGKLDAHFPLTPWQTGSGTQTHMNANEVIANRACQILKAPLGKKDPVHPNDHVNLGQSSNDSIPSVMHIASLLRLHKETLPALINLHRTLTTKAKSFNKHLTIGRTHLQDATPVKAGMLFETYARQINDVIASLRTHAKTLAKIPQGGTAVGSGINTHKQFPKIFCQKLSKLLKLKFTPMPHPSQAMASHDVFVELSGTLNTLASVLMKMGNDIRLLGSGPRCGLNELILPQTEPGSSIMPGKVNPTQVEALTQVAAHVMGLHTSITIANSHGHLHLNVFNPMILRNTLEALKLIGDSVTSFTKNCLKGITLNIKQMKAHLENSLMLVTALTPTIGYDASAQIAKAAHQNGTTLREEVLKSGLLTEKQFDQLVDPAKMV